MTTTTAPTATDTTTRPAPPKMQAFIDAADYHQLLTREVDDKYATGIRAWTIGQDPATTVCVTHMVFAYWSPGRRGGSLSFRLYTVSTFKTRKITRREAGIWLATLSTRTIGR